MVINPALDHDQSHTHDVHAHLFERFRAMPKVELHCHLDGSLRPETMLALAHDAGITLPCSDATELRAYMRVDDARNLEEYLARFELTIELLQTAEAIERVAYELIEDAHHDGIRYLEVRNAPFLNTRAGLSLDDAILAMTRGFQRGERDFGVMARVIVCSLRHWTPDISLDSAKAAVRHQEHGVVGFDLAGGEAGNPAALHADAFFYARANDLGVTCHAGEGDGFMSIRQALDTCGAYRIGHGTRAYENAALMHHLRDRRIPLEMCITSNVQTRVTASYTAHPIRRYFDDDLVVTINTDNRLMSGVTLTDEFLHAHTQLHFTEHELRSCVLMACDAAFLPYPERQTLRRELIEAFDAWTIPASRP